jgi:hypothetical protein
MTPLLVSPNANWEQERPLRGKVVVPGIIRLHKLGSYSKKYRRF